MSEVKMEVIDGVRYRPEHVERAKATEPAVDRTEVTVNDDGSSSTKSTGPATEQAIVDEVKRDQERSAAQTVATGTRRTRRTSTSES